MAKKPLNFDELKALYVKNEAFIANLKKNIEAGEITIISKRMLKEREKDSKWLIAAMTVTLHNLEKRIHEAEARAG